MKVLAVAQDFGFGPISMLNRALSLLPPDCQIHCYIPPHLAPVLDRREEWIVETSSDPLSRAYAEIVRAKDEYDAAIVACDYPAANAFVDAGVKTVVFDMLFWFWPEIHPVVRKELLVIAQNFVGVKKRASTFRSVQVVGPLLPQSLIQPYDPHSRQGVIVNLCGFKSPFHGEREAEIYASLLEPLLQAFPADELTIVGGELITRAVCRIEPRLCRSVKSLTHQEMLLAISRTRALYTAPGLGSIYESFLSSTPAFFLPPSNLTQLLQLQRVLDSGLAIQSQGYQLFDELPDLPEDEFIRLLFDRYELNRSRHLSQLWSESQEFEKALDAEAEAIVARAQNFALEYGGAGERAAKQHLMEYLGA